MALQRCQPGFDIRIGDFVGAFYRFSATLDRTLQRRDGLLPLSFVQCLACTEVDSERAEFCSARRLRRIRIDIDPRHDFESNKSSGDDRRHELSFDESAGDSAFPEVDVALRFISNGFLNENVADLKTSAWL